jgi:hypothetical protein
MYNNMNYTYTIENQANKEINIIYSDTLYILCYHITTDSKYPFLQFMMEKIPFCNNLVKEQFIIPYITIDKLTRPLELLVVEKLQKMLHDMGCNGNKIDDNMFKGIVYDHLERPYALVNITGIDISGLKIYRTMSSWFILPSEIINTGEVCNIPIEEMATELFTRLPELALLTNIKNDDKYMIPDVVYTGGDHKNIVFNSVFGNNKSKEYESCGDYYYFYRSFNDSIKDGGWNKYGGNRYINNNIKSHYSSPSNRVLVENEYGRYVRGGINRYALFSEGKIHIETNNVFSLTDKDINSVYLEPVIIICYSNEHEIKPDILVKDYDNFVSLTYHILDKSTLGEKYIYENNKAYMIL